MNPKLHRILCIGAMTYLAVVVAKSMGDKGYFEWGEKP